MFIRETGTGRWEICAQRTTPAVFDAFLGPFFDDKFFERPENLLLWAIGWEEGKARNWRELSGRKRFFSHCAIRQWNNNQY